MKLVAGVDIGNSSTEVCLAEVYDNGRLKFISSSLVETTGIKGTVNNVEGIISGIELALKKGSRIISELKEIRINEAAPVIGDTAMETITETIITESTMIGHNPSTPGGVGLGVGEIISLKQLKQLLNDSDESINYEEKYIVLAPQDYDYGTIAKYINEGFNKGIKITAAMLQKDEGVLVSNRLIKTIPIVDEIKFIEKVQLNTMGAVEVAESGYTIKTLSNPYGIATIFSLNAEETKNIVPVAKSLIGIRSAVVIKTPKGQVKEKVIPAGTIYLKAKNQTEQVNLDEGAEKIMDALVNLEELDDVDGEAGTNIGGMISNVKNTMAELTNIDIREAKIKDLLAIDTFLPVKVNGALAGETFLEKAVAVAAMVKTDRLPMLSISAKLEKQLGIKVKIAGVEAVMAIMGAMTTPGMKLPLAILDLGGGSTDAALSDEKGIVKSIHLAGAGELVTMLINSELDLKDRNLAEEIKKNPVAKVESLFHIRMENREIKFFEKPLDAKYFGRNVVIGNELLPIYKEISMEKIIEVRRSAKERIFVKNAIRALSIIAPMNNIRNISSVVIVGGSALDFEISDMILKELSKFKIVAGRGNIRAEEGPRNAVATGLVISSVL